MIRCDASTIAQWTGGTVIGAADTSVSGPVNTDSRLDLSGGIFIAKRGENADGHDYVAAARDSGAVIAIVEHPVDVDIVQIVVADSVVALGDLARNYLSWMRARGRLERVIAITGSVGKTTTKHLLGNILSHVAETVWPEMSFNNEVGLPLTVMRVGENTRFLVLEMGASHRGDITALTSIAPPDVGCVLRVGMAHAGEFGSVENIFLTKREMVEAVGRDGVVVLNADDERVEAMAPASLAPVVWFGQSPRATVRFSDVAPAATGIHFTLQYGDTVRSVTLHLFGDHNASNAAAAVACALSVGGEFDAIVDALEAVESGERWRMQVLTRPDGVIVINDGYNANPTSMSAALHTLAGLRGPGHRVVAVLGGMAELGDISADEHDRIGRLAVRLGIDQLVCVGDPALRIHLAASQEGSWGGESVFFPDVDAAFDFLSRYVRPGDIVLTKSSMVYGLRFLGDRLVDGRALA